MEGVNIRWTPQQPQPPPVNVRTPYQPGNDWEMSAWIRDAETQTLSVQALVREVFINMVVNRLRAKGLPLIACPHTRGLQLENVINGIVDSHSVMCMRPSHSHAGTSPQQQVIPHQQNVNDGNLETQKAAQLIQKLAAGTSQQQQAISHQQNINDGNLETEKAAQLIRKLADSFTTPPAVVPDRSQPSLPDRSQPSQLKSTQRKRPTGTGHLDTPGKSPKRAKPPSQPTIFKCDKCDKTFHLLKRLERHLTVHSQIRPYKCEKCEYRSKSAYECGRHYRRVHLNKHPHYCTTCGKGYATKAQLIRHEKQSHLNMPDKEKPFICKHCGKGFLLNRELTDHLPLHEKDRQFKCDLCPTMSATRKTRRRHLNQTHQVFASRISNKCLVCNLELHEYHVLIEHMKKNHTIAGLKCKECGAMFKNDRMLETHTKKDHPEPEPEEPKVLQQQSPKKKKKVKDGELSVSVDGKEQIFVKCKMCDGLFASKSELRNHMKFHKSESTKTEALQKQGPSKKKKVRDGELSVSVDGEEQIFVKCKMCGGLFTSRSELRNHMKLHKSESTKDLLIYGRTRQHAAIARGEIRKPNPILTKPNPLLKKPNPILATVERKLTRTPQDKIGKFKKTGGATKKGIKVEKREDEFDIIRRTSRTIVVLDKNQNTSVNLKDAWKTSTASKVDKTSGQKSLVQHQPDGSTEKTSNGQTKPNPSQVPLGSTSPKKPEKCFTIFTKSPDQVAQMLAKGTLKLSLNVNIPGTQKSTSVSLSLPKVKSTNSSTKSSLDNAITTSGTSESLSDSDKRNTEPVTESSDHAPTTESSDHTHVAKSSDDVPATESSAHTPLVTKSSDHVATTGSSDHTPIATEKSGHAPLMASSDLAPVSNSSDLSDTSMKPSVTKAEQTSSTHSSTRNVSPTDQAVEEQNKRPHQAENDKHMSSTLSHDGSHEEAGEEQSKEVHQQTESDHPSKCTSQTLLSDEQAKAVEDQSTPPAESDRIESTRSSTENAPFDSALKAVEGQCVAENEEAENPVPSYVVTVTEHQSSTDVPTSDVPSEGEQEEHVVEQSKETQQADS